MSPPQPAHREQPLPVLGLIEEAVHLLRRTPLATWVIYYVGALPFGLGLLYFWADMSRGAHADQRCAPAALGLTLLFVWMLLWQAIFVQRLRAQLLDQPAPAWTWRRLGRVLGVLLTFVPPALLSVPVAKPISFAFYQNLFYVADGAPARWRDLAGRAGKLAFSWILPGYLAHWAIWGFGLFVFLNVTSLLWLLPAAAKTMLGLESAFSRSSGWMFSSTIWAIAGVLSYLCLNPLTKAVYVLRCFYGESRQSAADLRADLRRLRRPNPALLLVLVLGLGLAARPLHASPTPAADAPSNPPVTAPTRTAELDNAIQRTLKQPRYLWRLPRERSPQTTEQTWLGQFTKGITDSIDEMLQPLRDKWREFRRWWRQKMENRQDRDLAKRDRGFWGAWVQWLALLLIGVILASGLILFVRWRRRRGQPTAALWQPDTTTPVPDLAAEDVRADQLPEDGWLERARELLAAGQGRLAVRALHLATLAHLAGRELITLARHKSDRDYERELARRARTATELQEAFTRNRRLFEAVWYGAHPVGAALLEDYQANLQTIRSGPA